jgi:hypothetical protein
MGRLLALSLVGAMGAAILFQPLSMEPPRKDEEAAGKEAARQEQARRVAGRRVARDEGALGCLGSLADMLAESMHAYSTSKSGSSCVIHLR